MNLLFDTNILIYISRDKSEHKILDFVNPKLRDVYVSYASIAEIESIAFQSNWSNRKIKRFESFLEEVQIIEIDDTLLRTYVNIDAFSQRKHQNFTGYSFLTPRNMGKNDLWTVRRCDSFYCIIIKSYINYN